MRITQGTFSYLPDLTDDEIRAQVQFCLDNEWAVSIEHTDDPHPRNAYWDMWGLPMFDVKDAVAILLEINACRKAFPSRYIKVMGYDRRYRRQTTGLSFLVHRPQEEPGFRLERQEERDRVVRYTLHSYATDRPAGKRYGD
ncbi:MAG: ribulose bisphosphate carboxylase small subunit [Gemmatimonadales bacterium]